MCKVLVVSEDAELKQRAVTSFSRQGCRVLCAADTMQGLNLARLALPDVMVLDDRLSDLDRDSLCGLRRLRVDPTVPMVVLVAVGRLLYCEAGAGRAERQSTRGGFEFEALGDLVSLPQPASTPPEALEIFEKAC